MSYSTIVAILTASLYIKYYTIKGLNGYVKEYVKEYVKIYNVELCLIIEYNIL